MTRKTYLQLTAELAELDAKIAASWKQERSAVVQELRELMATWGIEANELGPYRRGAYHTKPVKMRYRNPDTGQDWSGRGRPPAWIEGKDRSRFLIVDERGGLGLSSNRRDSSRPLGSASATS